MTVAGHGSGPLVSVTFNSREGPGLSRYIIFGAGAVGGLIGARLVPPGHDVTLVARGANRQSLADHGLHLRTADGEDIVPVPVVGSISELKLASQDVVILAMKTQ